MRARDMPLTKAEKASQIAEVAEQLDEAAAVYLTEYKGLKVDQVEDLRGRFRASGVRYRVVKNTLLRRAMEQAGGYDSLFEYLHGPTAAAFSVEPASAARVIKEYVKANRNSPLALKAAFVDGAVYSGQEIDTLASLKSRDELLGDIIGLLLSPIRNVVGAVQSPGGTLASMLAAFQK